MAPIPRYVQIPVCPFRELGAARPWRSARAAHLTARPAFVGATNRIAGALLIGAGLRIAALPRGE